MYNDIKLDKSLYNISGKTFTQVLSELDPDSQYAGTELANLDAYERQLKRFNIKTTGPDCDITDKFFQAGESAVLFPEFVRRSILAGMTNAALPAIVALNTTISGYDYRGFAITSYIPYANPVNELSEMPEVLIRSELPITLKKYGKMITITYESMRNQKLELLRIALMSVGKQFANAFVNIGITALKDKATSIAGTAGGFVYADLLKLYEKFSNYDLTTLVASPATCAALLALPELADCKSDDGGASVTLPFGPKLFKATSYTGTDIVALDKNYALEMIVGDPGVIVETDKLVTKQINNIGVSVDMAFKRIAADASCVLTYTAE